MRPWRWFETGLFLATFVGGMAIGQSRFRDFEAPAAENEGRGVVIVKSARDAGELGRASGDFAGERLVDRAPVHSAPMGRSAIPGSLEERAPVHLAEWNGLQIRTSTSKLGGDEHVRTRR